MNGEIEINEPVRVYDTSGPWGDPDFHGDVTQGLPPLRAKWIRERGDVEEINGREVQPIDDGFLSEKHAAHAQRATLNAQTLNVQLQMEPARPRAEDRCAHPSVDPGYATGVRKAAASSRPRWNSSRFEKISDAKFWEARELDREWQRLPNGSEIARQRSTSAIRLAPIEHVANRQLPTSRARSLPNSCGPKSRAAAPSFPQTSIIPNPSR